MSDFPLTETAFTEEQTNYSYLSSAKELQVCKIKVIHVITSRIFTVRNMGNTIGTGQKHE